jgi:hypothetical protein
MAHFARLDENNVVIQVIAAGDEYTVDENGVEDGRIGEAFYSNLLGGVWKQTSYNRRIRKNYASVGYTYNADIDAFVPPKPFVSWVLNNDTAQWEAPVAMPEDAYTGQPPKLYTWNEDTLSWIEIKTPV